MSIVGIVKLQRAKRFPNADTDNMGEMQGLTPPSRSDSAKLKQILSSCKVSPPNVEAIKTPSGSRVLLNELKVPSKSFTQCRVMFEMIRSRSPSLK